MTNEELVAAIQAGNDDLMCQLWKQCKGFICQQALKWDRAFQNRPDFDVDDLTQAGYMALCEAVRGYQKDRGGFLGFLSFYLKIEFSKVAGCRTETQSKEPLNGAVSLDAPAYNDEDSNVLFGETLPFNDPGFEDVERDLMNEHLAKVLDQAMKELPDNQRRVIELYYLHRMTYIQIAKILYCSTSYPGQLVKDGLKGLRCGRYAPTLSEILYGERNYYKHTGFSSWKYSGSSSPEWELLKKEKSIWLRNIHHCVDRLGMTMEQAQRLFPMG